MFGFLRLFSVSLFSYCGRRSMIKLSYHSKGVMRYVLPQMRKRTNRQRPVLPVLRNPSELASKGIFCSGRVPGTAGHYTAEKSSCSGAGIHGHTNLHSALCCTCTLFRQHTSREKRTILPVLRQDPGVRKETLCLLRKNSTEENPPSPHTYSCFDSGRIGGTKCLSVH